MNDREKIIKIIEKNGVYNGKSLSFDYYVVQPDDLADALIKAGYGDVKEWKRRAEVADRALQYAVSEYRCDECPCLDCNAEIRGSQECIDCICAAYKKEAAREIEEEERK